MSTSIIDLLKDILNKKEKTKKNGVMYTHLYQCSHHFIYIYMYIWHMTISLKIHIDAQTDVTTQQPLGGVCATHNTNNSCL